MKILSEFEVTELNKKIKEEMYKKAQFYRDKADEELHDCGYGHIIYNGEEIESDSELRDMFESNVIDFQTYQDLVNELSVSNTMLKNLKIKSRILQNIYEKLESVL